VHNFILKAWIIQDKSTKKRGIQRSYFFIKTWVFNQKYRKTHKFSVSIVQRIKKEFDL